jgi:hypothetical protein
VQVLATENKIGVGHDSADLDRLKQRLELLDERLDNIDSVLTAVAERIMKQPVSIVLNCPHCGKNIEVALVGQQKPT